MIEALPENLNHSMIYYRPLRVTLGLAALLLAACAPLRPPPDEAPVPEEPPKASNTAAVTALIGQARQAYEQGQYQNSIAQAERGLRIDRREAEFYLLLAQSYQRLGQENRARQFARLGLRYTPPESPNHRALQNLLEPEEKPNDILVF